MRILWKDLLEEYILLVCLQVVEDAAQHSQYGLDEWASDALTKNSFVCKCYF